MNRKSCSTHCFTVLVIVVRIDTMPAARGNKKRKRAFNYSRGARWRPKKNLAPIAPSVPQEDPRTSIPREANLETPARESHVNGYNDNDDTSAAPTQQDVGSPVIGFEDNATSMRRRYEYRRVVGRIASLLSVLGENKGPTQEHENQYIKGVMKEVLRDMYNILPCSLSYFG